MEHKFNVGDKVRLAHRHHRSLNVHPDMVNKIFRVSRIYDDRVWVDGIDGWWWSISWELAPPQIFNLTSEDI